MKHIPLLTTLFLLLINPVKGIEISSPDGNLCVNLKLDEGRVSYSVLHKEKLVIEQSSLGLITSLADFSTNLSAHGEDFREIDESYELAHGKTSHVHYVANELTAHYKTTNDHMLDIIFRVSDRDVAFAYKVYGKQGEQRIKVLEELSGYHFTETSKAIVTPQVPWGGGFARSKPSYEEEYQFEIPVTQKSGTGQGYTFPALFHVDNQYWVLLSETGTTGAYAGTHLSDPSDDGCYTIAFPDESENNGIGASAVYGTLPLMTPWRTITVGDSLAPIVETTVTTDLVKPVYKGSQEYTAGRATWSWILWQDASMNWDDQVTFIDLAAKLGYEYILIDAWWDNNIGRTKMKDLVAYAASKGVGVLLWYNSNGYWNDAYQTPRNCMDSAPAREREMAWMKSIGVKGIKVDFFGGDKQVTMKLYEEILTDANTYGLNVNFHGTTVPRGWERMYPNYMTSEAVLASENLVFSQAFADNEAFLSTLYPYIRNAVGPMDFGPVFLNKRFAKNRLNTGNLRSTTDTFQLATAILYQSPLQHFGVTPLVLKEQPAYVIDFLKEVPATWDEIRFIDGCPGEFVALARRKGTRWYIAATHSSDKARTYSLSLSWLKETVVTLLFDNPDGTTDIKEVQIGTDGMLEMRLEAKGGVVAIGH